MHINFQFEHECEKPNAKLFVICKLKRISSLKSIYFLVSVEKRLARVAPGLSPWVLYLWLVVCVCAPHLLRLIYPIECSAPSITHISSLPQIPHRLCLTRCRGCFWVATYSTNCGGQHGCQAICGYCLLHITHITHAHQHGPPVGHTDEFYLFRDERSCCGAAHGTMRLCGGSGKEDEPENFYRFISF